MNKRVAVIMPYHNGMKDFIGPALKAVANQAHVDVTLYIVDNGSTDGTSDYVSELLPKLQSYVPTLNIVKILCPKQGVAFARNAAMDELLTHIRTGYVTVDAVAFCDCDDVWAPGHLRASLARMATSQADMTYTDIKCVDEEGQPLQIHGIPYYVNFDRSNLVKQNFIFISGVVLKPECIESVGGFDHDMDPMGDWDYWLRVSEKYKVHHIDVITLTYLWKTKSGSYYDDDKMLVAADLVRGKHRLYVPAEIDKYHNLPGWLTRDEGKVLQRYAVDLKCLEIGSYKGKSSCYIADVAGELTCIDTFLADAGGQNQVSESTYNEFFSNTKQFGKKIKALVGSSTDVHSLLQDGYFDMIFVDAMHDYDSVVIDIKNYWSKLAYGGYMLFHDYTNKDYPGVMRAVTESLGQPVEVVDSIGVFKKGVMPESEFAPRIGIAERYSSAKLVEYDTVVLSGQEKLTEEKVSEKKNRTKVVAIAPFARQLPDGKENPKNMPMQTWSELMKLLHEKNIYTIQIGVAGEPLIGADEMRFNLTTESLGEFVNDIDSFISVDTFFQHFATYHGKNGVVIFSQSDPKIFGHSSNVNIFKSNIYFRANQFQLWTQTDYIAAAFPDANQVFVEVMKLLDVS